MGRAPGWAVAVMATLMVARFVTGNATIGGLWVLSIIVVLVWDLVLARRELNRRRQARRIARHLTFTPEQRATIREAVGSDDISDLEVAQEMVLDQLRKEDG